MNMPGFAAEASLYITRTLYRGRAGGGQSGEISGVMLAAESCQCTSPNCTWSCPQPVPQPPGRPFCHRGRTNCYVDCLARCNDPGGFCEDNCSCCCFGPVPRCYQ